METTQGEAPTGDAFAGFPRAKAQDGMTGWDAITVRDRAESGPALAEVGG